MSLVLVCCDRRNVIFLTFEKENGCFKQTKSLVYYSFLQFVQLEDLI